MHRFSALLVSAALLLSASGCAAQAPSESRKAVPPAPTRPVEAMEPVQKRTEIAETFPVEAPVAAGQVLRAQAQGEDAWDYELLIDSTTDAVADWYRQAYLARGWVVTDERLLESGALEFTFVKGQAESRVTVSAEGESARAVVILGVGAPVLQTQ